jgi:hypothetical protein
MKKERTHEDILRDLGVLPRAKKPKTKPRGKEYIAVKRIVKIVNKKFSPDKNRFVGFFPNEENDKHVYYVVTRCFYRDNNPDYWKLQPLLKKMFPHVNVEFRHLYDGAVYYDFTRGHGLYIT